MIRSASASRFIGLYTRLLVGIAGLYILLAASLNFDGNTMGAITALAAAIGTVQIWLAREEVPPSGRHAWHIAAVCALITTVVMSVLAMIATKTEPRSFQEMAGEGVIFIGIVLVAALGFNILVIRAGLWLGSWRIIRRI